MNTNPKLNASGYRDLTAYKAINNIDREVKYTRTEELPVKNNIRLTSQRIEHIKLSDCVPTAYQRLTDTVKLAKIIREFTEKKLGVLTVSLRDGNYYIIDGLHRSIALKRLGYTHAPCIVLTGMTYEQEADFLRKQDENKRRISTFDDFKAGIEAKDKKCLEINEILRENGFKIGRGGFFKINSLRTLFTIVNDYSYKTLDDTLFLLAHTWGDIKKASNSEILLGIAEFVSRYGVAEFSERLKNKFSVIYYDYAEITHMRGSVTLSSPREKLCRILVEHYNKGIHANSKKRLKWENLKNENRNK
jgi:hypothetical protein